MFGSTVNTGCPTPTCVDTTWTPAGDTRCAGANMEQLETSNCGNNRWTVVGPVVWTATGTTRCAANLVENQESSTCGLRWTATATPCGYCPSMPVSCGIECGYGFHVADPKDPAATVEMAPCPGDASVDALWIYPSAGPGHTVKVTDCDGVLLGYAANRSDCAPDCGSAHTRSSLCP